LLIVDEAQEMSSSVLAELRLLSAVRLDSQVLLTDPDKDVRGRFRISRAELDNGKR
jgi:hypothetical protein